MSRPNAAGRDAMADVLDSLRALGEARVETLVDHTGRGTNAVYRALHRLEAEGAVAHVGGVYRPASEDPTLLTAVEATAAAIRRLRRATFRDLKRELPEIAVEKAVDRLRREGRVVTVDRIRHGSGRPWSVWAMRE